MHIRKIASISLFVVLSAICARGQVSVVTQHNDNGRSGQNLSETTLNTSNVSVSNFGKLFWRTVDGFIYAQPLYVQNLQILGASHNVVYVATQHNSVYAFDADDPNSPAALWQVNLGTSVPSQDICIITGDTSPADCPYYDISPEVGITSTPAIDTTAGIIYVVARTKNTTDNSYHFFLHALSLTKGSEQMGGPVEITAQVNGTGNNSVNGVVSLDPTFVLQRPSLLLQNGILYIAFGSQGDIGSWHGWVLSYNASTLQQEQAFNVSPDGNDGGIWSVGQGLVGDSSGNVYAMTSNGDFNANVQGGTDYGDSFVKWNGSNLSVLDYFTPMTQATLAADNTDLGSGGPMLVPGTTLLVGQGKDGIMRVVDSSNMGKFNAAVDNDRQEFSATSGPFFSSPIYWNSPNHGPVIYVWNRADYPKAFQYNGSTFNTPPVSEGTILGIAGFSDAAAMSLSANQSLGGSGIVWANMPTAGTATGKPVPGGLWAFDATDLTSELWDSSKNPTRDGVGNYAKFVPPTVANGKVYLASFSGQLQVYGLNPPAAQGIQFVQSASTTPQSTTASVALAYSSAQTAGDLNVVIVGWHDAAASVQSVTDTAGNTYTLAVGPTVGNGLSESIYYAKNILGGNTNTVTVTFNQGAVNPDVRLQEYSGVSTSNPLDVMAGAVGNSYIANSGSVATNAANELLVGADMVGSGNITVMAGAPYNIRAITTTDSDLASDRIVNVPGAYYSWAPLNTTGPWIMQMVAFRSATTSTVPFVSSISPNSGPITGGTSVTITGVDFATGDTLMIGGVAATNVTVVNSTTITAKTAANSAGPAAVTVTNPSGQIGNLTSGFTYIAPPTVTSVSPNNGTTSGGTSVTITGTNFATGDTVSFGAVAAASVVVVNSTTITATTPAESAGAVTVTVTNSISQSGSLASGFTYVVRPTVTGVSPNSGPVSGGTPVTITGTNFASGATVTFGSASATNVVVVNSTTLTATTPAGTSGAVTVTVTVNSQSGSLTNAFTYGSPTISSVSPSDGSTAGGTAVTITGTNFAPGATVMFGGGSATNVVLVSSTTITATTPANGGGVVTVTVTNAGGQSGSLSNGFTYYVPAAIGFAQVASADPQGSAATVSIPYPSAQTLGDMNIVVVGWNDTVSTVQSVADSAGNKYSLAVGPTSATGLRQSIYYAPNIVAGSNTVTVTFSQAASYPDVRVLEYKGVTTLDVTAAATGSSATASSGSATTTSANELIFAADMIATTTKAAGTGFTARIITSPDSDLAEDEVVTAAGSYSATATLNSSGPWVMQMATFAAVTGPAPTVTGVSPAGGTSAGGTSVTITGTNFVSGATVTIGGAAATNVTVVNGTTITATTPAGTAGAATVTVTQGGQSGSLTSGFTYVAAPAVTSLSPSSGPLAGGTSVTIMGANFASGATVTFGSAAATNVVVVNSTTITATTPAGTAGAVTVTVTNTGGLSGSLASGFTYVAPPTVTSVSPNNGTTSGGTSVTITGTNFASGATVTFGSASATNVVVVSSTSITATTPAGTAGAVTVTVTNTGSQSGSLASGFTYVVRPTVTSLSPSSGPLAGGTSVTITGTNFVSGATVTFGSASATNVVVVSSTSITATTPAGTAGAVTVTVTVSGQSGSLTNGFTYIGQPTVTGVSPSSGPVSGGTSVTITGTNFASGATVTFGSASATNVVVVSSTSITATTPAGSTGAVTVTVTNTGSQSGSLASGFTYNAAVAINFSQVAYSAPQGSFATVSIPYPSAQTLGDMNIVVVGWNDTVSTVQSVADSAGNKYSLAVGPTSATGLRQSIYYAPNIVAGSNTVTVTFSQAASYPDVRVLEYKGVTTLDVTAAATGSSATASSGSATTTSANELIFAADMIATTTKAAGTGFTARIITSPDSDLAEDEVVTAAGSYSATATLNSSGPWVMQMATFAAVTGPAPTVTGVSPAGGTSAGGTSVTITGTNFVSGATVTIGGAAATNVTVVNGTTITATTPAGTAGAATVTVTQGGQSGSLTSGFTYVAAPAVTSLSPSSGPLAGGTSVTIMGANFASGATVTFGSAAATNVVVVNSTTITATTPAGTAGAVTVTVTNTGGLSGSLASGFTYVAPPTVTSVSPNNGTTSGGTSVTITGTNFASGATVTFGSASATNVVVVSSTSITATTPAGTAGAVTVTVTNTGSQSGSLASGFTYVVRPTVTSLSPSSGPLAGGTSVTITGTNFVSGATVTFGSASATNVVVVSSTSITATTPAGTAGAVTVTVTVSGQSGSLTNGFTYIGQPTVTGVSPSSGPVSGGTSVTITGTNFASGATVTFGSASATNVVVVSSTSITATTPAGSTGAVTVTVTNTGSQSGSLASGFTYNAAVAINFSQVAYSAPQGSFATVSIPYPSAQTLGDMNIVVVGWNDTVSTVQSVADSAGNKYSLAVGPTSATGLRQSIYYAPNIVAGSNTVTVTFSQAASYPDVRVLEYKGVTTLDVTAAATGSSATASSGSATTTSANELIFAADMIATTTKAAGTGFTARIITSPDSDLAEDEVVTAAGSYSATATLNSSGPWVMQMATFAAVTGPAPTVTGVSPAGGTSAGGTSVTITGTNFVSGATVTIGGAAATNVTVVNGTTITATTPAGTAGAATVTVTQGGQSGSLTSGFTYVAAPAVTSLSPSSGPLAGGTSVTIMGANFASGATVTFGSAAATNVVVVNSTTITATTPAGTAGAVTVTVTNTGGLSGSLASGFTYVAPPTVTSVSPNNGTTSGGTSVTITGTNFASGATVTFGSASATNVVVVSSTSITATTPAGTAGAVTVTVTNTGSQSGSLASGFTYVVRPTVTSLSPSSGPLAGGTSVTITGTNFVSGATVTFGSASATNVVVVSSTSITATTPAGTAGAVTVTVTVSGQSGSLTNGFTYIGQPTVTGVSPSSGPVSGGTSVTITGTNFASGATVTFGSASATNVVVVSSTSITATTPAGSTGAVTVTVTNTGSQSGSLASGFTYVAPDFALSASPTSVSVVQGGQGTTTITSSIVGGFNNSVALTASGLPTGTTAAFNPSTIAAPGSGNSVMTFTVGSATPVGTYTVSATGTGNGTPHSINVSLIVTGSSSSPCSNTNLGNGVTCVAAVSASNVTGTPVSSLSTTATLNVQPGDTLVAEVRYLSAADTNGAVSVETSAGDRLYYATGTSGSNGGWAEQIYYVCGAIANAASKPTVYFYTTQAYTSLIVHQYRGLVTQPAYNSCLDATATGVVASGTSVTSAPFTTTQANEVAFAAAAVDNNGVSLTAGPGYTEVATDPGGQAATEQAAFTSIQTNATASMSFPSNPGVIAVATFIAGTANLGAGIPAGHGVYVWAAVTDSSATCGGNCVLTVADSKSNSYTVLQTNNQASSNVTNYLAFSYITTALAGDGSDWVKCTFYKHNGTTLVGSTDNTYCRVFDMSQVASSGFLDSTNQNTDSNVSTDSGPLTVTSGNTDLIFAIWDIASATETITPGPGFTGILNSPDTQGGAQYAEFTESTSGLTPTITLSTGVSSYGAGAAIKELTPGGTVASVNGLVGQHVNSSSLIIQIPEWYGSSTVPTVTSVSPNSGSIAGGTSVTITGTNFASGATVTFGSTAATSVTVVNSTTITATTPTGSTGAATVTVKVGGQSGSLTSGFTYVAPPTVTSVSPNQGSSSGGTSVTITGTNFASGATVMFGSAVATNVTVVNSTTITATTPANSAGAVTVTVTNPGLQSGSLSSGFTYIVIPTVTNVSPNGGPVSGGTSVTITGTNFASGATVTFGSASATNVTVVNSTTLMATTPAGSAGTVTVTVTVGGQGGSLANAFTYGQPTVTSVSPSNGPAAGGTSVTITGANFVAGATVSFGSASATNVSVINSTTITATTPAAGSAGAVSVTVTNSGGQSGSLSNGFTYYVPAAIGFAQVASADPQGSAATVSIPYPSAQTLGDMNIVVVGWNDTVSTVQSVADSAGNKYSLAVGPTSATGLRQSIYYAPNIVAGSNTVTVTFSQAASYPDVRVLEYKGVTTLDVTAAATGSSATASSGSATTTSANELIFAADMIATTTKAAGTGFTARIITIPDSDIAEDKVVTTAGSTSATSTLNSSGPWVMQMATFAAAINPVPTVTSVSPTSGSSAGGTPVTITGTNFVSGGTVTIGGVAATNVVAVSSTSITATTPAGTVGAATVTVTVGGQSGSLTSGFTYVAPPAVTSLSSNNGPLAGGTSVTITGANFASGATVTFGSASTTGVTVVNSTTITATTPAGSAGAVTVKVTNTNGLSGSLASGFTYLAPPTVTGVSPNNGSNLGGTSVTVTGTNFISGDAVTFGGAAATGVTVVNSTTITATTPAGSTGAVTVTVTDPFGQSGNLASGFTYVLTTSVTAPGSFSAGLVGTATPTYVSGQQYYNSTALASHTTTAFNSTGADLLVAFVSSHNNVIFTVTDSYGNTWSPLDGPSSSVGSQDYPLEGEFFYVPNAKTGANHTITVGLSQAQPLIISIAAITGDNIYSPIDAYSPITGDNGTFSDFIYSSPLTTHQTNDLLFGITKGFLNKTFTAGTGYVNQSASTGLNFGAETGTASAVGTYRTNFTANEQDYWQSAITAIAAKPNQTSLSWTVSVGGPITNYFVERCSGIGCSGFTQIASLSGSTLTYTDTSITTGIAYNYRVRAENSAGMFSGYSTVQTVSPIVPTVVSSLTANSLKALAWNVSAESGGSVSAYSIERCQGTGCSNFSQIGTTAGTTYTDTSAVAGTTYNYRVRAQDANSFFGPYSAVATVNIPAYLDNAADGGNNGGTTASLTYPYTVGTNTNRLLVVNVAGSTSVDDISSVTYGGASLSLIKKILTPSGNWHYLYYLLSPVSGNNSIVITAASAHYLASEACSWFNIAPSSQPQASTTGTASSGQTLTASLPASANNAIAVESMWAPNQALPGNGSTELIADAASQTLGFFSSAASPVTSAYPLSMTNTWGGEQPASSITASFLLASNGTAGITFDNAVDGGNNGGTTTSLSYAYTVGSSANRLLIVNLDGITSADDISSVTYAGVPMTILGKVQTTNTWQYVYYLLNPASGSNNVVITAANAQYLVSQAASWSDVKQSAQPDALTINTAAVGITSTTSSLTTVASGALVVQGIWSDSHVAAGQSATPIVIESAFDAGGIFASTNSPVSPAESVSMTTISDGTMGTGVIMGSFSPAQ